MKQIQLIITAILILTAQLSFAQNCPDEVSTDPRNPNNPDRPELENNFFWFPHNGNDHASFEILTSGATYPSINNPFWVPTNLPVGQLVNLQNSDFYPEDGWELLKVNFGRLNDETERTNKPSMPYMILYNRYSGTMRFLGMWPNASSSWQIIRFQVGIPDTRVGGSPGTEDLDATNLLSVQGNATQPLDQQTEETVYEVITEYPGTSSASYFFWFDLPVAYDPCICNNDVAITLTATVENQWDVTVKGVLDAQVIQQGVPQNGNSNLVTKRIIGAAGATVTAIATGGSVINTGAFTGLLDIFSQRPGVSDDTQAGLELLQGVLGAAAEVTYDPSKLEWRNTVTGETLTKKDWEKLFSGVGSFLNAGVDFANPGSQAGKPKTSVVGSITASGTATLNQNTGDLVYLGVSGSNWTSSLDEVVESTSNGLNPEYPIYNNPLGVFALLQTPNIKIDESLDTFTDTYEYDNSEFDLTCHDVDVTKFTAFLDAQTLKYKFNPSLNLNLAETKVLASIVVREKSIPFRKSTSCADIVNSNPGSLSADFCTDCTDLEEYQSQEAWMKGINLLESIDPKEMYSPPVPLDYINEVVVQFVGDGIADIDDYDYFIRFQLEMVSHDIGSDGTPVKNTQIISFPLETDPLSGTLPVSIINVENNFHNPIYAEPDVLVSGQNNFSDSDIEIYAHIQSTGLDLSSILSTSAIHLLPGAQISPKIRLAIDYPFQGLYPQEEVSASYISDFCQNNLIDNQYQANQFSPLAPEPFQADRSFLNQFAPKMLKNKKVRISPNPAKEFVTVRFSHADANMITLIDLAGRPIFQKSIFQNSRDTQIDVSGFSAGVYIIRIDCGGEILTEKLVVAK